MEPSNRLETLLERLRARGLRLTPQRLAIVRALVNHPGHPSVEQLHQEILPDFPTTSLATVYKTVHLLKSQGEVLELAFGEQGSRFDGLRPRPHPHLICTRCGAIMDPAGDGPEALEALAAELAQRAGFSVSSHRFDIFGLCPACRG